LRRQAWCKQAEDCPQDKAGNESCRSSDSHCVIPPSRSLPLAREWGHLLNDERQQFPTAGRHVETNRDREMLHKLMPVVGKPNGGLVLGGWSATLTLGQLQVSP
jgi:hypothetical protein